MVSVPQSIDYKAESERRNRRRCICCSSRTVPRRLQSAFPHCEADADRVSGCTTEGSIPVHDSHPVGPAFARNSSGWMQMDFANVANARRTYEILAQRLSVCFWLPASSSQPCVHDQTSYVQSLLRLWTGIRIAAWARARKVCRPSDSRPRCESGRSFDWRQPSQQAERDYRPLGICSYRNRRTLLFSSTAQQRRSS